jgi:hypothetical protein
MYRSMFRAVGSVTSCASQRAAKARSTRAGRRRFHSRCSHWDGAPLPTVDATRPGRVNAIARQPDGGLIVGGRFVRAGTVARKNLLRLTPEGSLDSAWNAPDTADAVVAHAVGADGDVFAGLFVASDTAAQPVRRYAAGSGALDPTWSVSIGGGGDPSPMIRSLALDGRGHLVVGGLFNRIGGAARAGLARFAVDSGTLDAWTVPQVGGADELALAADGMMYIARDTTGLRGEHADLFGRNHQDRSRQ